MITAMLIIFMYLKVPINLTHNIGTKYLAEKSSVRAGDPFNAPGAGKKIQIFNSF